MNGDKLDFLCSIATQFDLHSIAYVGEDADAQKELGERLKDHGMRPAAVDGAEIVFLDRCYADKPEQVILAGWNATGVGGFLMGTDYSHDKEGLPVQRALAGMFNLMTIQIGPCAVWATRKGP